MPPVMQPVQSSNIAAVGHDPDKNELHVAFKSGGTYAYSNVSADQHQAMINSPSVGAHFMQNIRNSRPMRKA